jgi:hypothetical protein
MSYTTKMITFSDLSIGLRIAVILSYLAGGVVLLNIISTILLALT